MKTTEMTWADRMQLLGYERGIQERRQKERREGRQEGRREGRQEGRREGRQEGRREGRQKGQLEGARQTLLSQIRHRFPKAPRTVRRRLEGIDDLDTLVRLGQRLLEARDLADLGLDGPKSRQ